MAEQHPERRKSPASWTRSDREAFSFLELVWLAHVAETKSEARRLQSEWLVKVRDSELRVGFADPATSEAIDRVQVLDDPTVAPRDWWRFL
jgi:hypothetical protein